MEATAARATLRGGWLGRYAVEPPRRHEWDVTYHGTLDWARCRVVDVAARGAGLDLLGAEVAVGDRLIVDLQLIRSNMASVTLTGEVRHTAPGDGVGQRAGLEFVDVGDLERALLHRLLQRQKRQPTHLEAVEPETVELEAVELEAVELEGGANDAPLR